MEGKVFLNLLDVNGKIEELRSNKYDVLIFHKISGTPVDSFSNQTHSLIGRRILTTKSARNRYRRK